MAEIYSFDVRTGRGGMRLLSAKEDTEILTIKVDGKKSAIKLEISRLEHRITARRIREAMLTAAGRDWLSQQEALIALERAKLLTL